MRNIRRLLLLTVGSVVFALAAPISVIAQSPNPQTGIVGMQGRIASPPPSTAATISTPTNGQSFTSLPVTVSGLCPDDVLVKVFKNNVFAGSAQCTNGSYSLIIDLFNGQNELVARVYDALDQAGPDSNVVTVSFTDSRSGTGPRVSLTSNYAKRGANPNETLTWPITLSGGQGPYALSVDWGDGSTHDLISREFPGTFNIEHVYEVPGIYNVVVKATDANGGVAFLQLVGVANGPLSQETASQEGGEGENIIVKTRILWLPIFLTLPLLLIAFWLGHKHELSVLKQKVRRGERPF